MKGNALAIDAPDGALTEKVRAVLKEYKWELVAHLTEREQGPLCARCLDLDRDNPVPALPEPYRDNFYYCKRHHPALPQEKGGDALCSK